MILDGLRWPQMASDSLPKRKSEEVCYKRLEHEFVLGGGGKRYAAEINKRSLLWRFPRKISQRSLPERFAKVVGMGDLLEEAGHRSLAGLFETVPFWVRGSLNFGVGVFNSPTRPIPLPVLFFIYGFY